jgi:hypothetical protein
MSVVVIGTWLLIDKRCYDIAVAARELKIIACKIYLSGRVLHISVTILGMYLGLKFLHP